ncbi:MAG TPA: prepilin-type N-terminal cleavage/methylation domain-containing protein [Burkholderiaceae bacterium]|jgi:general secretion pathway protein G|nr:prepilin-type N-terminal cleavage/methylation domain-containing protein [Burkholderiaceae bacterium]
MKPAQGFTLVELLLALTIMGVLATAGFASYERSIYKARVAQAVTDMLDIATRIKEFELESRRLPDSLGEIGRAGKQDPWGTPYEYLNLETQKGNGKARKRKNLSPLNSDFDLYSVGLDKSSSASLMPKDSRDDVLRALDGRFMGLASDFDP